MRGRILYGISKIDNTTHIINEVNECIKAGCEYPLYIIVPEQYSSLYEQEVVFGSLEKGMLQVNVTTFKRLANKLFVKTLQKRNNYIDNAGKSIIVHRILNEYREQLQVFHKVSKYPSFSVDISNMIKELKRYEITYGMLFDLAKKERNQLLSRKLVEISLIYEKYEQELIHKKYFDSEDDLTLLANVIRENDVLDHSMIWLDKFNGFTTQEISCIREMLKKADTLSICLSLSELKAKKTSDVFYPILETYEKIVEIAENEHHILEEVAIKEGNYRTKALQFLCDHYYESGDTSYDIEQDSVEIYRASSIYDEVKKLSVDICKLVRENKCRYRDIVVGCSLLSDYSNYIEAMFKAYNIPVFLSNKRAINKHALIGYIMSLLQIYDEKYSFDSVFSFLKSSYCLFDKDEVSKLENYVLEWDIKGVSMWNNPWKFTKDHSVFEKNKVKNANKLRVKFVAQVNELFDNIRNRNTAKSFLGSLYKFLIKNNVYTILQQQISSSVSDGLLDYADELKQSWNIVMTAFNQINTVLGNEKYTTSKFMDLLKIAFSEYEIGVIPPSNDKVEVTTITRASSVNKKYYFIIGANDPSFPNDIKKDGILSDSDRVTLKEKGVALASDSMMQVIEQRLTIYEAISMADEKLTISYSIADLNHKSRRPSYIIERVLSLFSNLNEKSEECLSEFDYILTPLIGLERFTKNDYMKELLTKWFIENKYEPYFTLTGEAENYFISKEQAATLLFGDVINTSVSQLESFNSCPFKFFVTYGLKAKERELFSLRPLDIGNVIHNMLGHLLKNKISGRDNIVNECKKIFNESTVDNHIFKRDERIKFLGERVIDRVVFSYEELSRQIDKGGFTPKEFEIAFGTNKELAPLTFISDEGNKIMLQGRIDRVDTATLEKDEIFRIIDYKSSDKNLKLNKIKEGIDIQLALYLYAYYENSMKKPGGMYYFGANKPILSVEGLDEHLDLKEVHEKTRLNGYTIADEEILRLNDYEALKKSDVFSEKKQLSSSKLEEIFTHLDRLVKQNVDDIYHLSNEARPTKDGQAMPCDYCPYKSVCGFELDNHKFRCRNIQNVADKDVDFNE